MTIPDAAERARDTVYRPGRPLNLALTVGFLQRSPWDPTMAIDGAVIWLAMRTPDGIATLALRQRSDEVHATAWGPGAEYASSAVPTLCGADDEDADFDASQHPLLAQLAPRLRGLRLGRTDQVFDALAQSILEQKVTSLQAFRSWRRLVQKYGEIAPGPTPRQMHAAPEPSAWARIPSWAWHQAGVEPPQSKTLVAAATRGERLEKAVLASEDPDRVLTSLPGIGVWTSAETRIRALGDPDAVSLGDYHLPHEVGFALTGSRTDDAGMLELLAPWAGHRQRVIRMLRAAGPREPRRGARLAPVDHRGR